MSTQLIAAPHEIAVPALVERAREQTPRRFAAFFEAGHPAGRSHFGCLHAFQPQVDSLTLTVECTKQFVFELFVTLIQDRDDAVFKISTTSLCGWKAGLLISKRELGAASQNPRRVLISAA